MNNEYKGIYVQMPEVNNRKFHFAFGWCKITHPFTASGKTLIDLEADTVEYYVMGKGYVSYSHYAQGRNVVFVPVNELYDSPEEAKGHPNYGLIMGCMNVKLTPAQ